MASARTSCECNRREHDWTHRPVARAKRGDALAEEWEVFT